VPDISTVGEKSPQANIFLSLYNGYELSLQLLEMTIVAYAMRKMSGNGAIRAGEMKEERLNNQDAAITQ
jgi:hypothetical protein